MEKFKKIVTERGGRILEHRTTVGDLSIGSTFALQSLRGPYEVLFFYKDAVFDYKPMVCGLDRRTGLCLYVSTSLLTILQANNQLIVRRKRRY